LFLIALSIKLGQSVTHMSKHLVLLPGLDGTGRLFARFLAALPNTFSTATVAYPTDKSLSCIELLQLVKSAVPESASFVLVAESFSAPIALQFASSNPANLSAVIVCAGFVFRPIGIFSGLGRVAARPWLFKVRPPRWVLEYLLLGGGAPQAVIQELREALRLVNPKVLGDRVRAALTCDARIALARISVPLLYLQPTQDMLLAKSCLCEMKRIKPSMVIEQLRGPHLLLQREPQQAAKVICAFLSD
jgi:pimeloyl-ACP methyl ester carboxylesterase